MALQPYISEIDAVREVLLALQGIRSCLFVDSKTVAGTVMEVSGAPGSFCDLLESKTDIRVGQPVITSARSHVSGILSIDTIAFCIRVDETQPIAHVRRRNQCQGDYSHVS